LLNYFIYAYVEKVSDSTVSAANKQLTSSSVQVQPKEETKPVDAAKLSTEFVAEVAYYLWLLCCAV